MTREHVNTHLAVLLLPKVEYSLDRALSPLDSVEAFSQLVNELPRLHAAIPATTAAPHPKGPVQVFRGRFARFDLGFSYARLGNSLLVFSLWPNDERNTEPGPEVDCVLGRGD